MITKFKLFEGADYLRFGGTVLNYRDKLSYPFILSDNDNVFFGHESQAHGEDAVKKFQEVYGKPDPIKGDDTETIDGRIWIKYKVLSFWNIIQSDFVKVLKNIQDEFNNNYKSLSFSSNVDDYAPIDFFDDEWFFETTDIQKGECVNTYTGEIVRLLDYIKQHNNSVDIESDDEEYKKHLARR